MMRLLSWREHRRNTLLGFGDLEMESGLIVRDVSFHAKDGSQWASPPGRPMLYPNHQLLIDEAGKVMYAPVIDFASKTIRRRWSDAAVRALNRHLGIERQNAPGQGRHEGHLGDRRGAV